MRIALQSIRSVAPSRDQHRAIRRPKALDKRREIDLLRAGEIDGERLFRRQRPLHIRTIQNPRTDLL